jgi:hypothetical protein
MWVSGWHEQLFFGHITELIPLRATPHDPLTVPSQFITIDSAPSIQFHPLNLFQLLSIIV